jgi:methyl-accepting chemotaxis protein
MVEEATAASHSLKNEANQLSALVDRFQVGGSSVAAPAKRAPAARPAQVRPATFARPGRSGGAATAVKTEEWEEF